MSDLYVNPAYQYDAGWFDATTVDLTLTVPVDGKDTELTMNMREWSDALNGATVTVDGTDYCFGEGIADVETRLTILAAIEGKVLETYDYLPMLQNARSAAAVPADVLRHRRLQRNVGLRRTGLHEV